MRQHRNSQGWRTLAALVVWALAASIPGASLAEGNGFKFGDARLHPYFELEPRFDSKSAYVEKENGKYAPAGDVLMHFRPGLKLDMPGAMLALALNGNVDYVLYTGAVSRGTRNASYLGADADLNLGINREGQFGVEVGDHFVRSDRNMSVPGLTVGAISLYNDARLKLNVRPYSGAITIEPGYSLAVETFTPTGLDLSCSGAPETCGSLAQQNYLNHTASLNGRWKFLPKTAMTFDSAFGARSYLNEGSTGIMTLKAALGVAGLLTSHWQVLLRVGWGHDFSASSYSSVIAQAEVGYLLSQTGGLKLGYVRTFEPTGAPYVSYGDDRAYLTGHFGLLGKLNLRGTMAYDYLSFNPVAEAAAKRQHNISFDAGGEYEIVPWVTVSAGYLLTYQKSDVDLLPGLSTLTRHEVYLKLRAIY